MKMEGPNMIPPQENPEDLKKLEEMEVLQNVLTEGTAEDGVIIEERERADATRLEEIRTSLGMEPSEEKALEPVMEVPPEIPVKEKREEQTETPETEEKKGSSQEKGIEVDPSLKRKGLDFTDSLNRISGKLGTIDREAEIVSPGTISKFRNATRNLENTFQGSKLDLDEAATSFNRLTVSFDDLSLMNDREMRRITEDARKSLVGAIEGSKDSAMALRMEEKMKELQKNINRMIDKADVAAFRLRRGAR